LQSIESEGRIERDRIERKKDIEGEGRQNKAKYRERGGKGERQYPQTYNTFSHDAGALVYIQYTVTIKYMISD